MSGPRWQAMTAPKGSMIAPGNDTRHNLTDDNKGGSPRGGQGTKNIPTGQRGGFQQQGRDKVYVKAGMSGARGGTGNPASRGGFSGQARGGAFTPDKRVPGHGGSPQRRGGAGTGKGFGDPGQAKVPGGNPTQSPPGAGNTSGLAYRRIAGRFKRAAMGARPTSSSSGKYGSPPVTSNT